MALYFYCAPCCSYLLACPTILSFNLRFCTCPAALQEYVHTQHDHGENGPRPTTGAKCWSVHSGTAYGTMTQQRSTGMCGRDARTRQRLHKLVGEQLHVTTVQDIQVMNPHALYKRNCRTVSTKRRKMKGTARTGADGMHTSRIVGSDGWTPG